MTDAARMAAFPSASSDPFSTQPAMRRSYNPKDDWGRTWLAVVETGTGQMVGHAVPCGFTDPLDTPGIYFRIDTANPMHLQIDYLRMADDLEVALQEWRVKYEEEGFARYGDRFDPTSEVLDRTLVRLVGEPPMDPAWPRAAAAGDEQYLGVKPAPRVEDELAALREQVAVLQKQIILGSNAKPDGPVVLSGPDGEAIVADLDTDDEE